MLEYQGKLKKNRYINGFWTATFSSVPTVFPTQHITFFTDYSSDLKWLINRQEFEEIKLIKKNEAI